MTFENTYTNSEESIIYKIKISIHNFQTFIFLFSIIGINSAKKKKSQYNLHYAKARLKWD